eukprot:TRINITY_DN3689_c0_g1_i7.p1 TRINITY_DN3689_c0_g1~~TRINITY_DN3689_c0_g1_i7.p1  ORF type:complete len:624 (+),score=196.88 TRINITY_DN3689_c0_g1_i7:130-2001(+)
MAALSCARLILLFACLCFAHAATKLPKYEYVGRGVNVMEVAYSGNFVEQNLKGQVVLLDPKFEPAETRPSDSDYTKPKNCYSWFFSACNWKGKSRSIHAATDFQKELKNVFEGTADFTDDVATTLSGIYRETTSIALSFNTFLLDAEAMCQTYRLELKPRDNPLAGAFKNALTSLPRTFDPSSPNKFIDFFKTYGTHAVDSIVYGGMMTQRITMSTLNYTSLTSQNINVDAEVQYELAMNAGVDEDITDHHEEFVSRIGSIDMRVTGGDNTTQVFYEWVPTVMDNPVPLEVAVKPVFEYAIPELIGSNVHAGERRAALTDALQFFLQNSASIANLLPSYEVCQRGSSAFDNECEAYCPADYVLVGGACKVQDYDTTWPWRVTRSEPRVGSYRCRSGEDRGAEGPTDIRERMVYAMALCVPKVTRSDMSPPFDQGVSVQSKVVKCTGPADLHRSECTATCPDDYLLTGGGCEPDTYDSSRNPQMVAASAPSSVSANSWHCGIRNDTYAEQQIASANGFAVCTNWTSSYKFRPSFYAREIVSCHSGTGGEISNSCAVKCPAGHVVVGGGCSAWNGGSDPWRVSRSWPRDNGWFCEAGQDRGSNVVHQDVTGYAICIMFNLNEKTP